MTNPKLIGRLTDKQEMVASMILVQSLGFRLWLIIDPRLKNQLNLLNQVIANLWVLKEEGLLNLIDILEIISFTI
jgi:hypothetical protein